MATVSYPTSETLLELDATVGTPTGLRHTYPPSVTLMEFDATVPSPEPVTPEWRVTIVDQDGATVCQVATWDTATLQEQLSEVERLTLTLPYGSRAAELLAARDVLPSWEVQVWRGAELRMWGPIVSVEENDDVLSVTALGAFEHVNRTTCGLAGRRNELTNPVFDGLTGWGVYRSTGAFQFGDPTGLYSVVGDQSASGGPDLPSGVTGIVKVNNPLDADDVVALWQDVPCVAPAKQDMGVYLIFLAWVPSEPVLRNSQDLACALSLHEEGYSPPIGWFTEIASDRYGDLIYALSRYGTIKTGRWVKYSCQMTVPAGFTGTVHAVIQTPPGVAYMALPAVIYDNGLDYYQDDVATVVRGLVNHAQDTSYRKQDRNITADANSCPATGRLVDRFYSFDQHPQIGSAVDQLTREGLGDWSMAYTPSGRVFRWHYPKRGERRTYAKISRDDDGSNVDQLQPGNDWRSASNIVIVQQGAGGFTRAESVGQIGTLGWEEATVTPPETPVANLYTYATEQATRAANPQTLTAVCPEASVWGGPSVAVGDSIPVRDTARGRDVDADYRIIRRNTDLTTDRAVLTMAVEP